jgi:hypothetical protein
LSSRDLDRADLRVGALGLELTIAKFAFDLDESAFFQGAGPHSPTLFPRPRGRGLMKPPPQAIRGLDASAYTAKP